MKFYFVWAMTGVGTGVSQSLLSVSHCRLFLKGNGAPLSASNLVVCCQQVGLKDGFNFVWDVLSSANWHWSSLELVVSS